jgi:hypothetical protein
VGGTPQIKACAAARPESRLAAETCGAPPALFVAAIHGGDCSGLPQEMGPEFNEIAKEIEPSLYDVVLVEAA